MAIRHIGPLHEKKKERKRKQKKERNRPALVYVRSQLTKKTLYEPIDEFSFECSVISFFFSIKSATRSQQGLLVPLLLFEAFEERATFKE